MADVRAVAPSPPPVPPRSEGPGILSIRVIVTAVALAITTGATVSVGVIAERNTRRALTSEVEARLLLEARNVARASVAPFLSDYPELTLAPLVRLITDEQDELAFLVVVDHEGKIQGHRDSRRLGTAYTPPPGLVPESTDQDLGPEEALLGNRDMMVAVAPVRQGEGKPLGRVEIGLHREYVENLVAKARRDTLIVVGMTLLVAVAATFTLITLLLRPVAALRKGLERIGRGDLDTPLDVRDRTELGMLARAVNAMTMELKEAQSTMVEKERLSHELDLARQIQQSLLPPHPIQTGPFLVAGAQLPAAEVGGDYYDYFALPGGKVGLAIADVAGKGLGGCMITSMLSALLRAYKEDHDSPSRLLAELDEKLSWSLNKGTFVTMFYGILDPRTDRLVYASAAHCPTLIYRKGSGMVEVQLPTGIPLGAIGGGAIRETLQDVSVTFEAGDMLLQYTDGVNETFDPARREQFGFDRLQQVLTAHAAGGWLALQEGLRWELGAWRGDNPRDDDETLLTVTRAATRDAGLDGDGIADPEDGVSISDRELEIPARFQDLSRLRTWLQAGPGLGALAGDVFEVLHSALYEACANIIEHGYGGDPSRRLRLERLTVPRESGDSGAETRGSSGPTERFLIFDQGEPFRADNWEESDFADREVRKRGRGFGLDIIHRAMVRVEYHPSTPAGNQTLLEFDPSKLPAERKVRYA